MFEEWANAYRIPRRLGAFMRFYLKSRFSDQEKLEKNSEHDGMLREIPENLHEDISVAMFESLLCTHAFFRGMNTPCMVAVASCTKIQVYVRGEVVRLERNMRTAGQLSAEMRAGLSNNWEEEGIRFLRKGAVHSGWDLQITLFPPAMFDEDVFFSLHLSSRTSATKMYAVEYCEV